ncbi:MAG: DNA mismatch repair protein MutS [Gemmatimonadetes bacterium]|jgi:DNA mismatch repair protein MutS|nr:DNA mismatch repair protein MutS [Gemmatimonadota bacterium]MBT5326338.1 DNA mismatch repair protein MutS [Gemmatimonadota bacterium]MBT5449445.1 DNA mismatch repair protein MutS [Gemmatimonadota bacterium]MBT5803749.1 DNA mismatch repair protein MutS [Gemmatimonadota bacterium]MBT6623166.1 DNA mismatch repair protein MutS [Gemmatimonadota bacterium]
MPAKTKLTPAMEQYMHFKRRHKDAILFFRMGDFYEMFFDDAKEVSKLLGLTLTARNHGKTTGSVPLAGLPHHAMEGYLAKLIQLGRKVAICEQVEDPKQAKGVVKRDVVQVVSPGTALSDSMLDQQRNNFLVGLCLHPDRVGLASIDLSTGDFTLDEVDIASLADELQSLAPAELLIAEGADEKWVEQLQATLPRVALSRIDDWHFAADTAYEVLTNQLQVQSLKGFGCDGMDAAVRAGGATIAYLRDNQRGAVQHINRLQRKHREDFALIDATAQRNLELLANQHDGDRGNTLLEVLDRTCTPMGARLLRQWIMQPLKNPEQIEARLEAVDALLGQRENRRTLRQLLGQVGDLERLMARICCLRANGRDMVSLANSLSVAPGISSAVAAVPSSLLQELRGEGLPDVSALVDEILGALVDEPPATLTEGSLIRDGYHQQVDELRQIASGGKTYIARLQTTERERTGIASLKIGYNQVFGYYIEISRANLDKAPEEYHRKQTLANAERFITPELKEYEEKVIGAEDRLKDLENELFLKLRVRAAVWTPQVQQIARTLARMDTLCSFAETAEGESYVRPEIDDSGKIEIVDGRHPVVERQLRDGRFVPNDMQLDSAGAQIMLITGPNMAGKSTIIRQVGLIVLMGQIGSFVPARSAKIGVVDRIFTRVGASDNLARGESTFMVEMNEAANILNNTTAKSLILMDELGRGTSTFDGLSIAWAIVEFLHQRTNAHPRTLFATHYHEMTELESHLERVVNFNVQVREEGDRVIFLHRLAPGPADQSYGINVAQMAGMPQQVVSRAKEILARLEKEQIDTDNIHDTHAPQPAIPEPQNESAPAEIESPPISVPTKAPAQLNLFPDASDTPLTKELLALDLSQITPLQALLKLNEWKETIREESQRP